MAERIVLESGNRTRVVLVQGENEKWVEKSLLAFADVRPERIALAREARLSRCARVSGVAAALDEIETPEVRAFRREYIDGTTLASLRASAGRLAPNETLRVLRDLTRILASLHELEHGGGLIHGDVTPKNVYLARDGAVKLTDFGLSRFVNDPPLDSSAPRGTPRFLPPEVRAGESPSPAADVHQLALVAEYLLETSLEEARELSASHRTALLACRRAGPSARPSSRELSSVFAE